MDRVNQPQGGSVPTFLVPEIIAAAHELKSPLALIRQLSLSLESGDVEQAEMVQLARKIELTSDRALRLVEDISRSARLEDGLFSLEPISPVVLCDAVVKEISPLYDAHQRQILSIGRRRSPMVVADRSLLTRILIGFADNALHYAPENQVVKLTTKMYKGKVRIAVRDFGPGLSKSLWNSIKLGTPPPLQQTRRPASSGLGLMIASQFAEVMNAEIGATRHRDGTSFYIDLPLSTQTSLL